MNFNTILIILLLIVTVVLLFCDYYDNKGSYSECFEKSDTTCVDSVNDLCQDTNLLERGNELLQPPLQYMSVDDFNDMVNTIREIVINQITTLVQTCQTMNGEDVSIKSQLRFECLEDFEDMQSKVIDAIVFYVVVLIKKRFDLNLNSYLVKSDFMLNLNLLEDVVYPLLYSRLYTVHGINYFTKAMLKDKVDRNLKVNDVLYTTLLRRGVQVLPNDDDHIQ